MEGFKISFQYSRGNVKMSIIISSAVTIFILGQTYLRSYDKLDKKLFVLHVFQKAITVVI